MNHIFLFTIGPVQSFIAQARKTRDLYASSSLLTELIKEAIIETKNAYNAEIVFPYVETDIKSAKSLPNRFLAIIPEQEKTFLEIGKTIEKTIRKKWLDYSEEVFNTLSLSETDLTKIKSSFETQMQNHLEIYWIFEPIEKNYETTYKRIEKLLGSVKNTRYFLQQAEQGRKCSLDGQNNALFFGKQTNSNYLINDVVIASNLNKNEGLSAVSMLKRVFEKDDIKSFPSTATVATMDAEHLAFKFDNNIITPFLEYRNLFNGDVFNHQLYYEENLIEKYFKDQNIKTSILGEAQNKLKNLTDALNKINVKFGKYYAIICFDGDRMGEILSGAFIKDKMNTELPKFQNDLSKLLRAFAKWASETYLVNPKGKAIYAGGDDFLGFVNLRYLFEVMEDLRRNFECRVNNELQKTYPLEKEREPFEFSFSAGIAIAHYKEPLALVLSNARHAQEIAKDKGERNAFCMVAAKHSGENHETFLKWDYEHLKHLNQLLYYRLNDKISSKFFRMLGLELRRLQGGTSSHNFNAIVEIEFKRLMLRAKSIDMSKAVINSFASDLLKIYGAIGLERFMQLLYIVDFMARELKFAEKEIPQTENI